MGNINQHIQDFLEDYYFLPDRKPEYAVLLKGDWGTGKTWFIKKILKNLKDKNLEKHLYVSLYGVSSYNEIENEFFKQLCPFLSSKTMNIVGKIAKGVLKATVKVDLNDDGKSDASMSAQAPNINLPEYLTNTSDHVLIFDDLERASISIENILGYINYYVEHHGYKVVIIANENEILSSQENKEETELTYKRIKEKLVGKTFEIEPDFYDALDNFISEIHSESIKKFYEENIELLNEYYKYSLSKNLRILKQTLLDFERLAQYISNKAKEKTGLLEHLLRIFLMYSFEVKSGNIDPKNIEISAPDPSARFNKNGISDNSDKKETISIHEKYRTRLHIHNDFLLEPSIWVDFFDKAKISKVKIQQSLEKSSYFDNDWVKLWHFFDINDDEFIKYLDSVESDFESMKFEEIGEVKHITGIFMNLSEMKLYNKTKKEILCDAKVYIDDLKKKGKLNTKKGRLNKKVDEHEFIKDQSWGNLGFQGKDSEEFKDFCNYIRTKEDEATIESYPELCCGLLKLINDDPELFCRKVINSNHKDNLYHEIAIFHYITPKDFVKAYLSTDTKAKKMVGVAFTYRYKDTSSNESLKEELSWLQNVTKLLEEKADALNGKVSGFQLKVIINNCFKEAIKTLDNN